MNSDENRQPGPILGQIPHLPRSVQMHGSPSCTCLFCWDEIKRLRAEVKRLKAERFATIHPDQARLHVYGDGSWHLVGDDGFVLDWDNGPDEEESR